MADNLGLRAELDELGPSEWAFQTLLRIAAWGLHDDNRDELREMTKEARARFRAETPEETK
ncbi:hypothetical protein [Dactylosporangium sp. CA-139066]|uniref:hypothetical protein n=1 Tax=Dactylosporangium sp. CA-139066 TaxID=3239930 RepID=UPI003D94706D